MSHRESSYVIDNDVRERHYESCIAQHDVKMKSYGVAISLEQNVLEQRRKGKGIGVRK